MPSHYLPRAAHPLARFLTSWRLTTLTLVLLPLMLGIFTVYGRRMRTYVKQQLAASARATTVAEESFSSLRTVRVCV